MSWKFSSHPDPQSLKVSWYMNQQLLYRMTNILIAGYVRNCGNISKGILDSCQGYRKSSLQKGTQADSLREAERSVSWVDQDSRDPRMSAQQMQNKGGKGRVLNSLLTVFFFAETNISRLAIFISNFQPKNNSVVLLTLASYYMQQLHLAHLCKVF